MGSEYTVGRNPDTGLYGVKHAQAGHWIVGGGGVGTGQMGWPKKIGAEEWVRDKRARNTDLYGRPELPTPAERTDPAMRTPPRNGRRSFAGFNVPDGGFK